MDPKKLIAVSNKIGTVSIILLIYWVFINITISVFGLKVFGNRLSEIFYMSLWGIFALMFGALIMNVMLNLTRIANKHNNDASYPSRRKSKKPLLLFVLCFPLIVAALFYGNYWTSQKKEKLLIASAESIVQNNKGKMDKLLDYSFGKSWISDVDDILDILSKTDENFPYISVIQLDSIQEVQVFLEFENFYGSPTDSVRPLKKEYIFTSSKSEREYLNNIFHSDKNEVLFSADDGKYELYYPYEKRGKKMILYFSDQQTYGSFGK